MESCYGKTALTFDYPELFWLDEKKITVSVANAKVSRNFITGKYTVYVSEVTVSGNVKDVYNDVETAEKFQLIYEDYVDKFTVEGTDNYSKIKYIHDSIIKRVKFCTYVELCADGRRTMVCSRLYMGRFG